MVRLKCPRCEAAFTAAEGVDPVCPGCGFSKPSAAVRKDETLGGWMEVAPARSASMDVKTNPAAVASVIVGGLSSFVALLALVVPAAALLLIGGPVALVLGFVGKRQARERFREDGDGLANAGLVLGGIATGFLVLFVFLSTFAVGLVE